MKIKCKINGETKTLELSFWTMFGLYLLFQLIYGVTWVLIGFIFGGI